MSNLIAFLIIMAISLAVGGLVTGTYVAVENKKPENKDKPVSAVTIAFMMLSFGFAGIITYGGYYYYFNKPTPSKCATCIFNGEDLEKYNNAVTFLDGFNKRLDKLPRASVHQTCIDEPCLNRM